MTSPPRIAFLAGPSDRYVLTHLQDATSEVTTCGHIPALTMGPLPAARRAWPKGPKCDPCFRALPLSNPTRLRVT